MSGAIDTGLNGVPDEWELSSFGECAEIIAGQSPKGDTYNTEGKGTPLLNGPAEFGARRPTAVQWTTNPSKFAQKDDVLFCVRGNTTGRMNISDGEYCIGRGLAAIRKIEGKSTTPFVYFLLCLLRPSIYAIATAGGSTFPNISKSTLSEFAVGLPPLPEQKKIAHILSTVQRAIEAQERIIQTTTELKKALMHQLFTEGLRGEPQKQTEIGPIPQSWEVLPFDKFATLQRGYDLRKQDFRKGEVPVIGATQVIGYHDTANVKAPGVTVVRSGSSAGMPLFIAEDFWAHNVLLYVKNFHGNVPKFVYYKILAMDLTQYRQGVAVPTLNRNTFSAIELSVPSREEQQEIADALDSVESKRIVAERKSAQLRDLFRTLLHELMTAKTRVHELDISA